MNIRIEDYYVFKNVRKYIIITIFLLLQLSLGCKPEPKCDAECQKISLIMWMYANGEFRKLQPCSSNIMKPGDKITLNIPNGYARDSANIVCSENSWTLTAIPPPDGKIKIYLQFHPNCYDYNNYTAPTLLAGSSIPGEIVKLTGTIGCLKSGYDALEIVGLGSGGSTFQVNFN